MTIRVGPTAQKLRQTLELTQRETAEALGVSYVHLCNIENDKAAPSQALIDKYRELWGVDLYVMTWCEVGDIKKLPQPLRKAAAELKKGWQDHIRAMVGKHRHRQGA